MSNRRISEFPPINGLDIVEQDLLTLVHVFEVDPVLRNKKVTFTEFKNYLDQYYPNGSGGTFSGNVIINGNLTVTGTSNFTSITGLNLATFSGVVVQNNLTATGTISGITLTGTSVNATTATAVTGVITTPYRHNRKLHYSKPPDRKCWYPCCQWKCNGYRHIRCKWCCNFCRKHKYFRYAKRNYDHRYYSSIHHGDVYFPHRNHHYWYYN